MVFLINTVFLGFCEEPVAALRNQTDLRCETMSNHVNKYEFTRIMQDRLKIDNKLNDSNIFLIAMCLFWLFEATDYRPTDPPTMSNDDSELFLL